MLLLSLKIIFCSDTGHQMNSELQEFVFRVSGARHSVGIPARHLLCFWGDCAEFSARPSFYAFQRLSPHPCWDASPREMQRV